MEKLFDLLDNLRVPVSPILEDGDRGFARGLSGLSIVVFCVGLDRALGEFDLNVVAADIRSL